MMNHADTATEELAKAIKASELSELNEHQGARRLWVADEHALSSSLLEFLGQNNIYLCSNRINQVAAAKAAGVKAFYSDFELEPSNYELQTSGPWDAIFFRVAKEKAVVHHLINSAVRLLRDNGSLWLAGHKKEGTKTYLAKAEAAFGGKAHVKRGKDQLYVGQIELFGRGELLPDEGYSKLRKIETPEGNFWSKPGLFGWNKVDKGSQFLIETLDSLQLNLASMRVLDLGCGYGYLATKAAQMGAKELVATDNCAAAIAACSKNLAEFELREGHCFATDCAEGLKGNFDLILCNPPFHEGFSTSSELHHRFLKSICSKLAPKGQALVVANQFLRLQDLCADNGLDIIEKHRDNKRNFDLYRLKHRL